MKQCHDQGRDSDDESDILVDVSQPQPEADEEREEGKTEEDWDRTIRAEVFVELVERREKWWGRDIWIGVGNLALVEANVEVRKSERGERSGKVG